MITWEPTTFMIWGYNPYFCWANNLSSPWFWGPKVYTDLAKYVWIHHRSSIIIHCPTAQNQSNSISEGFLNGVDMVDWSWLVKFCFDVLPSLGKMKPKPCFGTYTFLVQLCGGKCPPASRRTWKIASNWVDELGFPSFLPRVDPVKPLFVRLPSVARRGLLGGSSQLVSG